MADEVGGNLNKKRDGHRGGTRLACKKVTAPKKQQSAQIGTLPHYDSLMQMETLQCVAL